jgi:hypothetical protein
VLIKEIDMKKYLALLGVLALSGPVLTACNSSDNSNTVVQPAVDGDTAALAQSENNLLNVGVKFTREGQSDAVDQGYLETFLQENRNVSREEVIQTLQNYIDQAQGILNNDGDQAPHRRGIEAKITAAEDEVSALEQEDHGGPHNHHE